MPSQFQYSTTLRDAQLNTIETTVATTGAATLEIHTGTQPANCAAAEGGGVLATVSLGADWLQTSTGGGPVAKTAAAWTGNATANGTATYFRIKGGTTTHLQGSVGTSASDMIVDNTNFAIGQAFTVNTFTVAAGNA